MGIEKNIKKLLADPTEMRLSEICNVLEYFGYKLVRIRGSHHHFKKTGRPLIILAVHGKNVTKLYIKQVSHIIKSELNLHTHEKYKINTIHLGGNP